MRWSRALCVLLFAGLILLVGCKPTVPSQYLQPDEMEDLMYDYYVSQGLSNDRMNTQSPDYQHRYGIEAVLRKYGISQAEFDSSLVYYFNNMERLNEIYTNIQKRLGDDALELGASEGEVERYTILSTSGDTTDVWEGRRQMMLLPVPPYHVAQFSQKADTSFHKGDSFLFTFGSRFLVQSGSRSANACLVVTYENDSVVTATSTISGMGGTSVRVNGCDLKARKIEGFVYMARRETRDNENDISMLFLDHIQLMRYHHKTDTLRTDTLKPIFPQQGERPVNDHRPPLKEVKPITKIKQ